MVIESDTAAVVAALAGAGAERSTSHLLYTAKIIRACALVTVAHVVLGLWLASRFRGKQFKGFALDEGVDASARTDVQATRAAGVEVRGQTRRGTCARETSMRAAVPCSPARSERTKRSRIA